MEQLAAQHGRDLKARAAQKALVASYKGAGSGSSPLLSRLGARLRARRKPAPVLLLVPRRSVRSVRSVKAVVRDGEAC
jgi:hypothetical protein